MLIEFVLLSNLLVVGVSAPVSMDTAPKPESSITSSGEVKATEEVRTTESSKTENLPATDSESEDKKSVKTENPPVVGEDKKDGKTLHDAHCLNCHNTEVYTRENRIISGLDNLKTHIQRCATNTHVLWFEEEVEAVATYLNENFYHFK